MQERQGIASEVIALQCRLEMSQEAAGRAQEEARRERAASMQAAQVCGSQIMPSNISLLCTSRPV